uniref:Daunorubicin resistance protein DrrA family ABC transporter ATP-binding protein n=1 Tax=Thermogemmatispora argillosa TaxID=2045280 RepID=A0A455T5G2_9CHLR|nr:daunorubicin resistance protein DrrA family ABC transporter ATP-binding protein [Thermogemmatispora argillosa]
MSAETKEELAIEVRDLVKRYPRSKVNAVDGISFSVRRGEIFGLLGPNGAGKTTTIGILTTSVLPTSGTVRIMGIDVVRDPIGVKQRISVVPQRSNLDQSLRAREILTFHAAYHGVPRAEREARADALLKELGLEGRGREKIGRYSGGMAQRLMLARALMHSPDVLFLDEPTNSLDPQSRLFLWDRIRAMHERGVTILLTTHDMEEAEQLCERIAIMDHGHILVLDTPDNLKKLVPGGTRLELRVRLPQEAVVAAGHGSGSIDGLRSRLEQLPGNPRVEEVPGDGEQETQGVRSFRLYCEEAGELAVEALRVVSAAGAELRDLHVARPSLEDVFIHLTGRNLRS